MGIMLKHPQAISQEITVHTYTYTCVRHAPVNIALLHVPAAVLKVGEVNCPPHVRRPSVSGTLLLNVMLAVLMQSALQMTVSALMAVAVTSQTGAAVKIITLSNITSGKKLYISAEHIPEQE